MRLAMSDQVVSACTVATKMSRLLILVQCGLLFNSAYAMRTRRNVLDDLVPLSVSFAVDPVVGECPGGTSTGLGSTALRLDYRNNASNFQWTVIAEEIPLLSNSYSMDISVSSQCADFRLVQEEHGGGTCNCWSVADVMVNSSVVSLR